MKNLQKLTLAWLYGIFHTRAYNPHERAARALEEMLELCQAVGLDRSSAAELVNHVYDKPVGEPKQELGGVMLTVLSLAERLGYDAEQAAVDELSRVLALGEEQTANMRSKSRPPVRAA